MRRRGFVEQLLGGGAVFAMAPRVVPTIAAAESMPGVLEIFPRQDTDVVREVVGAAHSDLAKVRELVTARPALAKATWDFGFGDWESALDAASHTGQAEIAKFLLANGARPTLFSAAMLGHLAVVRAWIEASPGIQAILGPHSITLLAHAKAGGEAARPVVAYLEQVGGADAGPRSVSVDDATRAGYVGVFAFGPGADEKLEVIDRNNVVRIGRTGGSPRALTALGNHAFHPPGAPAVRVTFVVESGRATRVRVQDGAVDVVATRVG